METQIKNAACMIIINPETGKFLGVSRKTNHNDMGLIGGKVDDEDYDIGPTVGLSGIEYAAIRECREETGLLVTDMIPIFSAMARARMVTTYLAISWNGEIRSSEEGVVRWVDLDELYNGTYGPYNKLLIREIFKLMINLKPYTLKKIRSNYITAVENEVW